MVTIEKLQKKIALQEAKNRMASYDRREKDTIKKAKNKLYELKFGKAKANSKKLKTLSKKFGKGLLKTGQRVGKKVGPAVIKQARLIQEQNQRDAAREQAMINRRPKKRTKSYRKTNRKTIKDPFDLSF